MGFSFDISVPVLTVFLQGLVSFFSPCVLPLLPLYIGYLSGGTGKRGEDGRIHYERKKVMIHTLCFVIGVSFAFFLLGFGFSAMGNFFKSNQLMFARVGGILVVLFGLYQLGFFGTSQVLGKERRLPFKLDALAMSPFTALLMGFTFSFAWTPCVGPALASVLLMASSSASAAAGFGLVAVYTIGFVLPFLAVGLFTGEVLRFFRTHGNVVKYTVKVGGALLIVMGVMTATGWMNGVTSYLSSFGGTNAAIEQKQDAEEGGAAGGGGEGQGGEGPADPGSAADNAGGTDASGSGKGGSGGDTDNDLRPAPQADVRLVDQHGVEHSLSDYRGKTVFLNFFATWCGPCKREIPDIEHLYRDRGENAGDLVVLGVANPKSEEYPYHQDVTQPEVEQFLEDGGYTFPVVMDVTGEVFYSYGISAFPTTFMIGADGNVFGYVPGALTGDMMESIVQQTIDGVEAGA